VIIEAQKVLDEAEKAFPEGVKISHPD